MRTLNDRDDARPDEPFKLAFDGRVYVLKHVTDRPVGAESCDGCVGQYKSLCERLPGCDGEGSDFYNFVFEDVTKMKIHVCTTCGSPRVMLDAYVPLNDPDDVRTFDDIVCDDCGKECSTKEVEVPANFDLNTDFYKEKA